MTIKAVLFDLYGTLLIYGDMNSAWSAWLSMLQTCLSGLKQDISEDALKHACDGMFGLPEPTDDGRGLTVFERRMARLIEDTLGLTITQTDLREMCRRCVEAWQPMVSLDPDAIPVLRELRSNCRLALVSNFDHPPHERKVLAETGLAEWFDAIVISAEVGCKKPDPRIFKPALKSLQVTPGEAVYVGDSIEDFEGATAAGIAPISIRRDRTDMGAVVTDYRADDDGHCETSALDAVECPVIGSLIELPELLLSGLRDNGGAL